MSCKLFNTLTVFTHPNDNIWFGNAILKTKNADNIIYNHSAPLRVKL
jgi:hypothetical protein